MIQHSKFEIHVSLIEEFIYQMFAGYFLPPIVTHPLPDVFLHTLRGITQLVQVCKGRLGSPFSQVVLMSRAGTVSKGITGRGVIGWCVCPPSSSSPREK